MRYFEWQVARVDAVIALEKFVQDFKAHAHKIEGVITRTATTDNYVIEIQLKRDGNIIVRQRHEKQEHGD